MSLPNKFEFTVYDDSFAYTAEVVEDTVFVTCVIEGEKQDIQYRKSSIESWVKEGSWKITKVLDESILSKITEFAKETDTDVIIDKTGFVIQYRDFDFVRVGSLDKLQEMMDIVTAFHKVMHGKQEG